MVRLIAEAHGKKIKLVKLFNIPIKLLGFIFKFVNKVFGNMVYELSMSEYKDDYKIIDYNTSIMNTEK